MRRLVLLLCCVVLVLPAHAQEARRSGDATARMQLQLQQLAAERQQLQADNERLRKQVAGLEQELDSLRGDRQATERRAGSAEQKASRAEAGRQAMAGRLEANEARLQEVVGRYRELAATLRTVETERNENVQQAAQAGAALRTCVQRNLQLAGIANEALDRYEKKGCLAALAQKEPFTQLKRVEIENAVDDYRGQVEELTPAAASQQESRPAAPSTASP